MASNAQEPHPARELPSAGALEQAIKDLIRRYNHSRYHESRGNLTPADVYFGCDKVILSGKKKVKEETFRQRRLLNQRQAA